VYHSVYVCRYILVYVSHSSGVLIWSVSFCFSDTVVNGFIFEYRLCRIPTVRSVLPPFFGYPFSTLSFSLGSKQGIRCCRGKNCSYHVCVFLVYKFSTFATWKHQFWGHACASCYFTRYSFSTRKQLVLRARGTARS
jgi:hypothetical protein